VPVAVLAVVVLVVIAGYGYLKSLRGDLERRGSEALGVPVQIESLSVSFGHGLAFDLEGVHLATQPPVTLPTVQVAPNVGGAASGGAGVLRIADARLKPSERAALASSHAASSLGDLEFVDLSLALGEASLAGLQGSMRHAPRAGHLPVALTGADGRFTLEARPEGGELEIVVAATDVPLPSVPSLQIANFEFGARMSDRGLVADKAGLVLFGGRLTGKLVIDWVKEVSVAGSFDMAGVEMRSLANALLGARMSGRLSGTLQVQGKAPSFAELERFDSVDSSFRIDRGSWRGVDLGAVLRERAVSAQSGGETSFEVLRGRLEATPQLARLRIDQLDVGALGASGTLLLGEDDALSGNLRAVVHTPANGYLQYPLEVGGTPAAPTLQLRRAY
jgi:uncharacterized protein involved in outer membrane biogenesis